MVGLPLPAATGSRRMEGRGRSAPGFRGTGLPASEGSRSPKLPGSWGSPLPKTLDPRTSLFPSTPEPQGFPLPRIPNHRGSRFVRTVDPRGTSLPTTPRDSPGLSPFQALPVPRAPTACGTPAHGLPPVCSRPAADRTLSRPRCRRPTRPVPPLEPPALSLSPARLCLPAQPCQPCLRVRLALPTSGTGGGGEAGHPAPGDTQPVPPPVSAPHAGFSQSSAVSGDCSSPSWSWTPTGLAGCRFGSDAGCWAAQR